MQSARYQSAAPGPKCHHPRVQIRGYFHGHPGGRGAPIRQALAPDEFAFDSVRKFAIEIGTKHWAGASRSATTRRRPRSKSTTWLVSVRPAGLW